MHILVKLASLAGSYNAYLFVYLYLFQIYLSSNIVSGR